MKIAIISDTHDNLGNLEKALKYINEQKAEVLIHAGDLEHVETLDFLCKKFHGKIYCVEGNAEIDADESRRLAQIYPELNSFDELAELNLGGLSIAITHRPKDAKKLAATGKYDLVIHGHDHKPWQSFVGKCEILNPGNIADIGYPATLAIYDTETRKASLVQLARILSN